MKKRLKGVGKVPAKKAREFSVGEVIALDHGYTHKIIEINPAITGSMLRMKVEHVPEENEFHGGESYHIDVYAPNEVLGIAERHGNEGLKWKGRK